MGMEDGVTNLLFAVGNGGCLTACTDGMGRLLFSFCPGWHSRRVWIAGVDVVVVVDTVNP